MLPLSAQAVMALAFVSAFSRAGLNIVDRYQIGLKKLSILNVNLWNNAVPAFIMTITAALFFGLHRELLESILDWKTILFSGLVQLVAYTFSYAFRYLTVNQVTVAGKMSDLFIPIGVFFTTQYWNWGMYGFAAATTLVCLPMLWTSGNDRHAGLMKTAGALIGGALVLQASLAPVLMASTGPASDVRHALAFTTAVIIWRTAWSLMPMLRCLKTLHMPSFALLTNSVFMLRALLTVITQTTLILAVGSTVSVVAWPILNSTGVFAMLLSALLLREKHTRLEKLIVVAISTLALMRFFSL